MNRVVLILAAIISFLLLAPYLGIDIFGGSTTAEMAESAPVEAHEPTLSAKPKSKQTMVEDVLDHSKAESSPPKLAEIEHLLKNDGEDK